jgi:hypothetical protein
VRRDVLATVDLRRRREPDRHVAGGAAASGSRW